VDGGARGGAGDQPGDGVVDGPGVPGPVAGPGPRRHHDPVGPAPDPGRGGLPIGRTGPQVQGPPAASPFPQVIARAPAPAHPAPRRLPSRPPDRHHDRRQLPRRRDLGVDVLHDQPPHAEQPRPWSCLTHAVGPPSNSHFGQRETGGAGGAFVLRGSSTHPRIGSKSLICQEIGTEGEQRA